MDSINYVVREGYKPPKLTSMSPNHCNAFMNTYESYVEFRKNEANDQNLQINIIHHIDENTFRLIKIMMNKDEPSAEEVTIFIEKMIQDGISTNNDTVSLFSKIKLSTNGTLMDAVCTLLQDVTEIYQKYRLTAPTANKSAMNAVKRSLARVPIVQQNIFNNDNSIEEKFHNDFNAFVRHCYQILNVTMQNAGTAAVATTQFKNSNAPPKGPTSKPSLATKPANASNPPNVKHCTYCGKDGHKEKRCFKKYKDEKQKNKVKKENSNHISSSEAKHTPPTLSINDTTIPIEFDSGSSISLIPADIASSLIKAGMTEHKVPITYDVKLAGNIHTSPKMMIKGQVTFNADGTSKTSEVQLYVVDIDMDITLIGRDIIKITPGMFIQSVTPNTALTSTKQTSNHIAVVNEFQDIFTEKLQHASFIDTEPATVTMKPNISPVKSKARPLVGPVNNWLAAEIAYYVEHGYLSKNNNSVWSSPVNVVDKDGGANYRITNDLRKVNALIEPRCARVPIIEHLLNNYTPGMHVAQLDVTSAYKQLRCSPQLGHITSIITPIGVYSPNYVIEGLVDAPAIWQSTMDDLLGHIQGVYIYLDDIIVIQKSKAALNNTLKEIFTICRKKNIKLKLSKCKFDIEELSILGYKLNKRGVIYEKITSLQNMKKPIVVGELLQFYYMLIYMNKCIPNYINIIKPLQKWTSQVLPPNKKINKNLKNQKITWTPSLVKSFKLAVEAIKNATEVTTIQPDNTVLIECDASEAKHGACIFVNANSNAKRGDDGWKPFAFHGKFFTNHEKNWSIVHKELYAIVSVIKRYKPLLITANVVISSDNLDVIHMINGKRSYTGKIGHWLQTVDSVNPQQIIHTSTNDNMADIFTRWALVDEPTDHDTEDKIQITDAKEIIKLLSDAHMGFRIHHKYNNMVTNLKQYIWKNKYKDIKNFIHNCPMCCYTAASDTVNRPLGTNTAEKPFQIIHMDFLHIHKTPNNLSKICVIRDQFSGYTMLYPTESESATSASDAVISWIQTFCIPAEIRTDNGPSFRSHVFKDVIASMGSATRLHIPYMHQSNGAVERIHKEIIKAIRSLLFVNKLHIDHWPELLGIIEHHLNHHPIRTKSNKAPFTIITGLPHDNPVSISTTQTVITTPTKFSQQVTSLHKTIEQVHSGVIEANVPHTDKITNRIKPVNLMVGELVLCSVSNEEHPRPKVALQWGGPFRVTKLISDWRIEVENILTGKKQVFHSARVKRYAAQHIGNQFKLYDLIAKTVHGLEDATIIDAETEGDEVIVKLAWSEHYEADKDPIYTYHPINEIIEIKKTMLKQHKCKSNPAIKLIEKFL